MAAAVPAALGLGGSIFGGITGKNAAKKQEKLAREQMAMIKPLLDAQISGSKFALDQSRPFLEGARQGVTDLQNFWQPLMRGDRAAIDAFLAPERRSINQGYKAVERNLAQFGPRGGGRISSLANADVARQGQLNDLVFGGRQKAAGANFDLSQLLGSLGTSTLSSGLAGGSQAYNLLGQQQNRAYDASNRASDALGGIGTSLGGFLADLFRGGSSGGGGGNPGGVPLFTQGFGGGSIGG